MAKNFHGAYNSVNRKRQRDIDLDLRNLSGANIRDIDMDEYDEFDDYEPLSTQTRFPLHNDDY